MNLTKGKGISLANCTCSWWKKKMIHELRSAVSTNSSQFLQLWLRKWRCCLVDQAPAPASGFCFEEVVASYYRSCESKIQCIRLEVQPTFFIVWLTHRDGHRSRKKEGSFSFVDLGLGASAPAKKPSLRLSEAKAAPKASFRFFCSIEFILLLVESDGRRGGMDLCFTFPFLLLL